MIGTAKDQDQSTLIGSRVRHFIKHINPSLDLHDTFRVLLRMLVSDHSMQPIFKRLIRQELNRATHQQPQTGGVNEATKTIRQRVKKRLVGLVQKEWNKAVKHKISEQNYTQKKDENRSEKPIEVIEIDQEQSKPLTDHAVQPKEKSGLDAKVKRIIIKKYLSFAPKAKLSLTSAFEKTTQFGHFQYGDKISRIIDHQMSAIESQQNVLIEWQPRKDGSVPAPSMLPFLQFSYFRPLEAKLFQEQARLKQ